MAQYFDGIVLPNKSKVAFKGVTKKIKVVNVRQQERDERPWPKKVVATKRIDEGEIVGCYAGEIKTFSKDDKEDLKQWTPFQVIPYLDADNKGNNYYIDASKFENELKYVCDVSCTNEEGPNVEFMESEKKLSKNKDKKGGYYMSELYAIRDIVPGEEIIASYLDDYWAKVLAWSHAQQQNEEREYESDDDHDDDDEEELEIEDENEDESIGSPAFVVHDSKPATKKGYEEQSRRTREVFEKLRQQAEQNKKSKNKEKKAAPKKGKKTERDNPKVYMCEKCFMITEDRKEYDRHMTEKHEGEYSDKYNEEWEKNDNYVLAEGDPEYNLSNEAEPGPIRKRNKTTRILVK